MVGKTRAWAKSIPLALSGVSTLALLAVSSAAAQTAGTEPEEIIVTAQRRSERLQDVPISITSVTPVRLERAAIANMRDLTVISPGLITQGQGGYLLPAIRGVSSVQTDPGNDANVAIYIDGVYQADQAATAMDLPDVERIEVLKGPQGTLFGRNATGGAIRIFTRDPSLETFAGSLDVGYGNYNAVIAKGFVTAPIVAGKLAASASASFERIDSYTFNVWNNRESPDTKSRAVRLKLLAQPTENLSIMLFGGYAYRNDGDVSAYTSYVGNSIARGMPGAVIPTKPFTYALNGIATAKAQTYTSGLRASLDTGIGEFTSTTAYNAAKSFLSNDGEFSTLDLVSYPDWKKQNTWSQELIFSSKKFGQFQFIAGGFYYGDTARYDPLVLQGSSFGGSLYGFMRQRTDAYAGFGEVTYEPTDRLTFIAGARYSHERRSAEGGYFVGSQRPAVLPAIGAPVSYNSFTPRASLRYRLTEAGDNAYFTYSKGFKSGGFNLAGVQPAPFKPETLHAYEIGLKTSPSRMFSANVAAFYYDYKDQQESSLVNNLNITTNAASSRIYGADAEIITRFSHELSVTTGVSVLDAKFEDYRNAPGNIPIVGSDPSVACLCGNQTAVLDLSGGRKPFSPTFTLSVSVDYETELDAGTLGLSANVYYSGKYNFQAQPLVMQRSYATLALRGSFQPTDSNFSVYVWGKNITGTRYILNNLSANAGDAVRYARPATYGGGVKYEF